MNLRVQIFFGQFLCLIASLKGKTLQGIPGYGRNLLVKTLPAIEDYQSNVYEVFMEPYLYDFERQVIPFAGDRSQKQFDVAFEATVVLSDIGYFYPEIPMGMVTFNNCTIIAPRPVPGIQAVVYLQPDEESGVTGQLVFTQFVPNGPVTIEGNVTGLTPGLHGIHIHQIGSVKDNCKEIGPHFIAYYGHHGGPRDPIRHVGDLGNIKAEEGAETRIKIVDHVISLTGPRSVVGRALALTKDVDDYGKASTEESALTGTSGPAVACGLIGYLN